jgi:hypothetical protein
MKMKDRDILDGLTSAILWLMYVTSLVVLDASVFLVRDGHFGANQRTLVFFIIGVLATVLGGSVINRTKYPIAFVVITIVILA